MPEVLETIQNDRDCTLTQVERCGSFAIFHRAKGDRCRGYELIHIRYHEEAAAPGGGIIPAGERYPSAGKWGKDGISIPTLEQATERLSLSVTLGKVASAARMAPARIIKPAKNPRKKK